MARNDHEDHVAEARCLREIARRLHVGGHLDVRQVERVRMRFADRLGHFRIVRPEDDLVVVACRDDRHCGAERAGADDRKLQCPSFRSPKRRSVPFTRRAMFEWCFRITVMTIGMLSITRQNGASCARKWKKIGIDADERIEESETKRVVIRTRRKTMIPAAMTTGSSARKAPLAVATPFPPWNRSHTGNMCPRTAMNAASVI